MMQAVVYTQYGPPEVLSVQEVETPAPGEKELLIRVRATEVTKADCELRSLNFPVKWFSPMIRLALGIRRPRRPILGSYFAGVVESVGPRVTRFQAGDEIFGSTAFRFGAYGQYMCLPENYTLAIKPEKLSFEESAATLLGGWNALHFMRKAALKLGESILINGAGGSIGLFAVQLARHTGAHVTAVDAGHKEDMLRKLGVDEFIDYTREDFRKRENCYDVLFNVVASASYGGLIRMLKPGGRYVTANPKFSDMLRAPITSVFTSRKAYFAFAEESETELRELRELMEGGHVRPVVDRVYALETAQIVEAHHRVEKEERLGSVVLRLDA